MPKEIWNEGRVTGLSAHEIYVRQHLLTDPDAPPISEQDWLASNILSGNSLLLEIGTTSEHAHGMLQVTLPEGCTLYAASTIVASYFDGDAEFNQTAECRGVSSAAFASRVTSYGRTISNTNTSSPTATKSNQITPSNVPTGSTSDPSAEEIAMIKDYVKLADGVVIHPGDWVNATNRPPRKDFQPTFGPTASVRPVVRFYINGTLERGTRILLTGFKQRSTLEGVVGSDGSTNTDNPQNGDFLGPDCFPWASKIIFSIPNSYIPYIQPEALYKYQRTIQLPDQGANQTRTIKDTAIVDMQADDPGTFYTNYDQVKTLYGGYTGRTPGVAYTVVENTYIQEGNDVLSVYQPNSQYPPALYATHVKGAGGNRLNPLDVVAPGTVKMFNNSNDATTRNILSNYEQTFPGTHAFNLKSDGTIQYLLNNQIVSTLNSDSTSFSQVLSSGVKIGTITIDGVSIDMFAPGGGGASYAPIVTSGIKIGTFDTDSGSTDVFTPDMKSLLTSANVTFSRISPSSSYSIPHASEHNYIGVIWARVKKLVFPEMSMGGGTTDYYGPDTLIAAFKLFDGQFNLIGHADTSHDNWIQVRYFGPDTSSELKDYLYITYTHYAPGVYDQYACMMLFEF